MDDDGDLQTISISAPRSIGGIIADVTIEEVGTDELEITQHPVEGGAAISDHAFKNPAELVIKIGFSNSADNANGDDDYCRDMYAQLLALQLSRQPLTVVTGKRMYSNMLIRSLTQPTDQASEFALFLTVTLKEIIIVSTQLTTLPATDVQANPASTASPVASGAVQLVPAPNANVSAFPPGVGT